MKQLLLTVVMALGMSLTANAQFTEDGKKIWDGTFANYGYDVKTNKDGITFAFFNKVKSGQYPMVMMVLDKDGNFLTDPDGIELSNEANRSWTSVNEDFNFDIEGNAVAAVCDQRLGHDAYTVYKVSPKGELLWGNKMLNNGEVPVKDATCYNMHMCPTSDGGMIFAYAAANDIFLEKLDKDGNTVWNDKLHKDDGTSYAWPYIVNMGENQVMLFFTEGAGLTLKARLIDMDGSSVWGEDVTIYRGGFGSMPVWVQCRAGEGPEGGVFAYMTESGYGNYVNKMIYVLKDDGSFAFSDGEGGTVISNDDGNSRQYPDFYYDENEQAFYCAFRFFNQANQSWVGIAAQKISTEGELLWGPNGVFIVPSQNGDQVLTPVITNAPDGKTAVFYHHMTGHATYGPVETYYVLIDKDGNMGEPINVTPNQECKNGLKVSQLIDGDHWVVSWNEHIDGEHKSVHIQWVNVDGTVTKTIETTVANPTTTDNAIYSLDGRRVNNTTQKGIYIQNGKKIVK